MLVHRRGSELAEIGIFCKKLFPRRPPRLWGEFFAGLCALCGRKSFCVVCSLLTVHSRENRPPRTRRLCGEIFFGQQIDHKVRKESSDFFKNFILSVLGVSVVSLY
jgi:hypothetical protein